MRLPCYGIDTRALIKLLVAGRLLLIFEGFDEVDLSGDSDARIEHFKIMWGLCYPQSKILVTGRPNYFLDDAELKAALGIQAVSVDRPYCQAVQLAPFGFEEIEHSLRSLDAKTRQGIIALAKENERFRDIVSRPSMLHVVSILWHTENLAQYGQRINSALVMDLFVRHSLERQGGKGQAFDFAPPAGGKAKPAFMMLNSRERAYFMEGIAAYMLTNYLPNQITGRQLEVIGRMLIEAIPDAVSSVDAQGGEPRKPLRQRYDINKPEDIQSILTDIRACGLLVPDLSRGGSFKFGHKSFMEFLAGKVFVQWCLRKKLDDAEEKSASSLVNKLRLKMLHVVWQQEVLAFAVEWIAEKAKDHKKAARLLFTLLFCQRSWAPGIIRGEVILGIRCLAHRSRISTLELRIASLYEMPVLTVAARTQTIISSNANVRVSFRLLTGKIFPYIGIFAVPLLGVTVLEKLFSSDLLNFLKTSLGADFNELILKTVIMSVFVVFLYHAIELLVFLSGFVDTYFKLILGYKKQVDLPIWVKFRAWYAICAAAHLDRPAMAAVVGEKALCLLEKVANQEPRPWTIAESLERLKKPDKRII